MFHWQYTPLIIPLILTVAILIPIVRTVWMRRPAPGSTILASVLLLMVIWTIGYALQLCSVDIPRKLIWLKCQIPTEALVPPLLLFFAFHYTGRSQFANRRNTILLLIVPLITAFLTVTNDAHGLVWRSADLVTVGTIPMLHILAGYWGVFSRIYLTLVGVVAISLLIAYNLHSPGIYQRQISALALGFAVPFSMDFSIYVGLFPLPHVNLAPFGFLFTGIALALGLFRYRLLDLSPISRYAIVQKMHQIVIVLDEKGRVSDLNASAEDEFGLHASDVIGQLAEDIWPEWPEDVIKIADLGVPEQVVLGKAADASIYHMTVSSFTGTGELSKGHVIHLHPIRDSDRTKDELRRLKNLNESIVQTMAEGIMLEDADGFVQFANPKAVEMLGYTHEEIIEKHWKSLIPAEWHDSILAANERRARGIADRYEAQILRKDGSRMEVQISGTPLIDGERLVGRLAVFTDITDRKKAEQALMESHERFLTVLDGIEAAVFVSDLDTYEILFMNKHMRKTFPEGRIGQPCWKVIRGEDGPCGHCTNSSLIDSAGEPAGVIVWEGHNPITDRWYINHDRVIRWVNGRQVRLEIATDITELKRVESEMIQRGEELDALREISLAISSQLDLSTLLSNTIEHGCRLLDVSSATIYLTDQKRGDLELMIHHGFSGELQGRRLRAGEGVAGTVLQTGLPFLVDDYQHWENRSTDWDDIQLTVVLGVPLIQAEKVIGVMTFGEIQKERKFDDHDIWLAMLFANQVSIAIQNARLFEESQRRTSQLEALSEISRVLGMTLDLDEVLHSILKQLEKVIPYDGCSLWLREGATMRVQAVRGYENPEDHVNLAIDLQGDMSEQEIMDLHQPQLLAKADDGERFVRFGYRPWMQSFLVAPLTLKNKMIGFLTIANKESERYTVEMAELASIFSQQAALAIDNAQLFGEIQRWAQELTRSNAELEHFAYIASHDLQEPLRMITSYMQLLERRYRGKLDDDADEFIGYAVDGAKRMQRLINGLLTYSRVARQGKEFKTTDCNTVVESALENLKISIEESGAQIECQEMPIIEGDETQLVQLFQNLVGNAIKFTDNHEPKVAVRAERQDGYWLFSVKDNGIGISPENIDRIFMIFQRLHSRKEYPGTGIGLAVCKKIVERHKGQIWVESKPDEGSTFYFTLPGNERVVL
jgi:PAS domain S-box-containing protein